MLSSAASTIAAGILYELGNDQMRVALAFVAVLVSACEPPKSKAQLAAERAAAIAAENRAIEQMFQTDLTQAKFTCREFASHSTYFNECLDGAMRILLAERRLAVLENEIEESKAQEARNRANDMMFQAGLMMMRNSTPVQSVSTSNQSITCRTRSVGLGGYRTTCN